MAMSKAGELMERVLSHMAERELPVWYKNGIHEGGGNSPEIGSKILDVSETCRRNGTEENVTVTIVCLARITDYSSKIALKVKVPKNASDRVINKRLDEVESWLNG